MLDKDDYKVQRSRLESLIREMEPSAVINWDEDRSPNFIRLRVDDAVTGAILIVSSGDWHVSEIADKSDNQLRAFLSAWSANRLR
jgi:hypothetical protein